MAAKNLKNNLHAFLWKEEDLFVAKCVEVEIASQGKTKQEATRNLKEALELYFQDEKTPLPTGLSQFRSFTLSQRNSAYA